MNNHAKPTFEMSVQTVERDIDVNGHVNNVVYLQWVQDAAVAHWDAWATSEQKSSLTWVVLRHEIDYKRAAFLNETLILRTWIGDASGAKCTRHTHVLRQHNEELLADALTTWCLLDLKSLRPRRVDTDLYNRFALPNVSTLYQNRVKKSKFYNEVMASEATQSIFACIFKGLWIATPLRGSQ